MNIVALADIHGRTGNLVRASKIMAGADLILLAGDITHFGDAGEARTVIEKIRAFGKPILAVAGNCDLEDVAEFLAQEGIGLHGRVTSIGGVCFAGLGGSLPCPGATPSEFQEDDFRRLLEKMKPDMDPRKPLVMLTHQPPRDTVADRIFSGSHVGSLRFLEFLEERLPLVWFCGHIHESRGLGTVETTQIVNPGPFPEGSCAWCRIEGNKITELEIRNF